MGLYHFHRSHIRATAVLQNWTLSSILCATSYRSRFFHIQVHTHTFLPTFLVKILSVFWKEEQRKLKASTNDSHSHTKRNCHFTTQHCPLRIAQCLFMPFFFLNKEKKEEEEALCSSCLFHWLQYSRGIDAAALIVSEHLTHIKQPVTSQATINIPHFPPQVGTSYTFTSTDQIYESFLSNKHTTLNFHRLCGKKWMRETDRFFSTIQKIRKTFGSKTSFNSSTYATKWRAKSCVTEAQQQDHSF